MPNDTVQSLTIDEVLATHQRLIEQFGGAPGLRDPGLLESALYRPRTGYYADLAEMAAALFESLLMNSSFVDGNKRTAFFATDVFLRLNGWAIRCSSADAHRFLVGSIERGKVRFETLLAWLRETMRPLG